MATKTTTPAEAHAAAAQNVERWTAELEAARAQVEKLTAEPVADPAVARKQATALATAKEFSFRCARALDDAIDARDEHARAVVRAEADALAPEIAEARAELETHDARTAELLAPLREHTGRDWAEVDPVASWRAAGGDGRTAVKASTRARLAGALRTVERRRDVLLAAARGDDPAHMVSDPEDLPDSLKPGGVLPSPSLVARQAQEAEQVQAEQEHARLLAEAQAHVDAALEALGVSLDIRADQPGSEWTDQRGARWREQFGAGRDEQVWSDIDGHLARMPHLQMVASLAGWENADRAAAVALPSMAAVPATDSGEDQ